MDIKASHLMVQKKALFEVIVINILIYIEYVGLSLAWEFHCHYGRKDVIGIHVLLQFLQDLIRFLTVVKLLHDLGSSHVEVFRPTKARPKENLFPHFPTVVLLHCLLHDLLLFFSVVLGIWPFLIVLIEDIEGEGVGEVPEGNGGDT